MGQRVQKILSQWGIASRRQAEQMILAGRVRLNGAIAQLGQTADPHCDRLEVDGQPLVPQTRPALTYLLLNKPPGIITTCRDPQNRPTVLDLLPEHLKDGQGIHPVGRLDRDSTGALLLTNDGNLAHHLTHPRFHLPKTYRVWVAGYLTPAMLDDWRAGIELDGKRTLPAQIRLLQEQPGQASLEIILTEGRNRQIRRIAAAFGLKVLQLHRLAIGSIGLSAQDGTELPLGGLRPLSQSEVCYLQKQAKIVEA
ncbi:MAG: rRNA pseudouridine synthase [Chloroflexaceae bacterium]|nr:rRNA pseudouridine synthase [Chloroflexaceae bacterium]